MTERQEAQQPEKPKKVLSEIDKRRLRLAKVGDFEVTNLKLYFKQGFPPTGSPVSPEHLFGAGTRESLLVPADQEIARINRILNTNTTGISIEEPSVPRGLQILISLINNVNIKLSKRTDLEPIKYSMNDDMITTNQIKRGIDYIAADIIRLYPNQTDVTMLDYADKLLLFLAKGKPKREPEKPILGRPPKQKPAEEIPKE